MAQNLPYDILHHIFTNYSSIHEYFNLMLVCCNWYQTTKYERFWLATLDKLLDCEIKSISETLGDHTCNNENNQVITPKSIIQEKERYLKKLQNRKQNLILDLKPFIKRREYNQDIYGETFKWRTVQFIRERKKRMIALEMTRMAIEFENDILNELLFEAKWDEIIGFMRRNSLYNLKTVANLRILQSSTTIFHILLRQWKVHLKRQYVDSKCMEKFIQFFLSECGLNIQPYIDLLVSLENNIQFLNKDDFINRIAMEVKESRKTCLPPKTLLLLIQNSNMYRAEQVQFITRLIEMLKNKKHFHEQMVNPFLHQYMECIVPSVLCIEIYFKDLNISKCTHYSHYNTVNYLCRDLEYITSENVIEVLQRAQKEFGLCLNIPLPENLVRENHFPVLKFLIENGADVNAPPPNTSYCYGYTLVQYIRQSRYHSIGDQIVYLVEHGAVLPEDSNSYAIRVDNVFNAFFDIEEIYLPTLKFLVEKFGMRFTSNSEWLHNIERGKYHNLTVEGFLEVLIYLENMNCLRDYLNKGGYLLLAKIIAFWDESHAKESNVGRVQELRQLLESKLDIVIDDILIDLCREECDDSKEEQGFLFANDDQYESDD